MSEAEFLLTPPTEAEIADVISPLSQAGFRDGALTVRRLAMQRDRLRAIVDRLPKTADGVPIVPGMKVYPLFPIDDPEFSEDDDYATCVLKLRDALTGETFEPNEWIPGKCYSTQEAAEAARKEGTP